MTHPELDAPPTDIYFEAYRAGSTDGLTRREYLAAKALQGLLANPSVTDGIEDKSHSNSGSFICRIGLTAVQCADELIKGLSREDDTDDMNTK